MGGRAPPCLLPAPSYADSTRRAVVLRVFPAAPQALARYPFPMSPREHPLPSASPRHRPLGRSLLSLAIIALTGCSSLTPSRSHPLLVKSLTFHASFDRGTDADFALGDSWIYHAPSLDRIQDARPGLPGGEDVRLEPGAGRYGGALHFTRSSKPALFYRAGANLPWATHAWSGTVSFWLRTDLAGLAPGFCDPVNITPRSWDDAAFFVEFERRTNTVPFRLGMYADKSVWNPTGRDWGALSASEKPLVSIPGPPFAQTRWTHVVFTWEHFNTGQADGVGLLYLDGAQVGSIRGRKQTFTWDAALARIHLGLSYIGYLDDFAVFNRALDMPEIQHLRSLPGGVRSLYTKTNRVP